MSSSLNDLCTKLQPVYSRVSAITFPKQPLPRSDTAAGEGFSDDSGILNQFPGHHPAAVPRHPVSFGDRRRRGWQAVHFPDTAFGAAQSAADTGSERLAPGRWICHGRSPIFYAFFLSVRGDGRRLGILTRCMARPREGLTEAVQVSDSDARVGGDRMGDPLHGCNVRFPVHEFVEGSGFV